MLTLQAAPAVLGSLYEIPLLGGGLFPALAGKRLLLLEDDYHLAAELAGELEDFGIVIVGPFPRVDAAMAAMAEDLPDFAALDINIGGRPVFPIADEMVCRKVPFVFYTGYDASLLPLHLQGMPCVLKPAGAPEIMEALARIPEAQSGAGKGVVALLPALRRKAILMTGCVETGDLLVEKALCRALETPGGRPLDRSLRAWIEGLMERVAREDGLSYWQ